MESIEDILKALRIDATSVDWTFHDPTAEFKAIYDALLVIHNRMRWKTYELN